LDKTSMDQPYGVMVAHCDSQWDGRDVIKLNEDQGTYFYSLSLYVYYVYFFFLRRYMSRHPP